MSLPSNLTDPQELEGLTMAELPVDAYQKALERIQELTGCLEDTPEEQELIALTEAVQTFENSLLDLTRLLRTV